MVAQTRTAKIWIEIFQIWTNGLVSSPVAHEVITSLKNSPSDKCSEDLSAIRHLIWISRYFKFDKKGLNDFIL